jgi:hypothetical protein
MVRIPGWAQSRPLPSDLYAYEDGATDPSTIKVNGEAFAYQLDKGYAPIPRTWQKGDVVEVSLPMPVRRVRAHPNIKADIGRIAVERGPLVFAAEFADNDGTVSNLVLDASAPLVAERKSDLLNGVAVITGQATALRMKAGREIAEKKSLTLIPYYAWAHRGRGEMAVWIAADQGKARVTPEPTLASSAKVSASDGVKGISGVNNQFEPESSIDPSSGYAHWWPKKGTPEWIQYDFAQPATISETSVYWFDDTGTGECRLPVSWKALYKSGEQWIPVKTSGAYGVDKDKYNAVRFAAVRTTALRLEIQLPEKFSTGIQEWKVR